MSWWFHINFSPDASTSVSIIVKKRLKILRKKNLCYALLAKWNLNRIKNIVSKVLMGKEIIYWKCTAIVNKEKFVLRIKDTIKYQTGIINIFYCNSAYWGYKFF